MKFHARVTDALDRTREVEITATADHVAIVFPAPGSGGMTADEADAFAFTVQAAANWARRLVAEETRS
jgi:hypothetical protein